MSALPLTLSIRNARLASTGGNESELLARMISLEVRKGEFFSILCPEDDGESALLRMIAGLIPSPQGEILVDGVELPAARRKLGLAFRRAALLPWRTVLKNVLLQAEMLDLNLQESSNHARRLLAWFGLSKYEECRPDRLPPGMTSVVAVCRAMVHHPSLLLLDEPFSGLDSLTLERILDGFQRLWIENRITAILFTRNILEAVLLSDRIAVLAPAPAGILEPMEIDLPRPRRFEKATAPQFAEHCNRIRTVLRAHGVLP